MINTLNLGQQVFVITRDKNELTAVKAAVVCGERDGHYECKLVDTQIIERSKYRRPSQVFPTEQEAQTELDYLQNYIQYRMSGHKMK